MALSAGTRLGPYEILAPLGAGGMGEVYRATDTKLGRDVAIKVLPPDVTRDPVRLARFQREAHLLASLNHPHIAAIHGLEESDGQPFLVLELVEGQDLRERLARGPIPVDEALEIAEQVAEALEEAHTKGIVHRDLKPANVKLTPEGKVKVLDFGLAKAWAGDAAEGRSSSAAFSQSPTLENTGTAAGVILGTAAYMSPEQARGKPVDKRADIWAFGVALWEMLTGQALFAGDTVTDVIAAVMTKEPDFEALPAGTPRAVRRLLVRCLRKDPRSRMPDMGAVRLELQDLLAGAAAEAEGPGAGAEEAIRTERHSRSRERVAWSALAVVLGGLSALLIVQRLTKVPEPRPVAHFVVDTPEELSFGSNDFPAVSPDGRHVAFAGVSPDGSRRLWIRDLESPEVRSHSGTEGARAPFWSPDGKSIAFSAADDLKRLTLAGGAVKLICSIPRGGPAPGTWNAEDTIVFSSGGSRARLFSVPATGGEARPLEAHDEWGGETGHLSPWFLPDGRHVLFDVRSPQEESAGVHVAPLDAPEQRRRVLSIGTRVVYASGHLLFVQDGILLAQPFDTRRLGVAGDPVPVAENVSYASSFREYGNFSASPGQVLAYREGRGESRLQLTWLDRAGTPLEAVGEPGVYRQIALSPDGRRVVLEVRGDEGVDLWAMDISRGVSSRVTSDAGDEGDPVWSPDGRELIYHASGNAFRRGLGAGAQAVPVFDPAMIAWPESWSSDGETLFFVLSNDALWAHSLGGDGPPELLLETGFQLDEAQPSPDGRWLAYISNESGGWEVYIQPFRRPGEKVRVSVDGGGQPKWRGDGQELYYVSPRNVLMAIEVREEAGGLDLGLPTELFEIPVVRRPQVDDYAVSADGQRFLVKVPVGEDVAEKIHVVTNWTSLLK